MLSTRLHLAALPLAIAALALAACGGDDNPDKAGGSGPAVTLRIGSANYPDSAATDAMETFAREVETLSDRKLRIKLVWKAAGMARAWDQRVARKVIAGDLDMGMIPARAWDTEGVTSMRALHAPFLVTSDELAREVVTGDLADEMLAGLDELGLVGLALIPEGLRHPVGFGKPLRFPCGLLGHHDPDASLRHRLRALPCARRDAAGLQWGRLPASGAQRGRAGRRRVIRARQDPAQCRHLHRERDVLTEGELAGGQPGGLRRVERRAALDAARRRPSGRSTTLWKRTCGSRRPPPASARMAARSSRRARRTSRRSSGRPSPCTPNWRRMRRPGR